MELTNQIILLGSAVLLLSVLSSVISARVGAPILLVFLVIGMLLGEEGPGGVMFHEACGHGLEADHIQKNVSVFAGRIADTGRDPVPHMRAALELLQDEPGAELIWASPRELLNVFQADEIGCHIITVTNDIIAKLALVGKNQDDYSLETVQMFYRDASAAGYSIKTGR